MTEKVMKDVLLVGFGAVGAICETIQVIHSLIMEAKLAPSPDSLILQRGGLARVTAVARSNYSIVQGVYEEFRVTGSYTDLHKEHGMNIQSQKYGNLKEWRPYRSMSTTITLLFVLT